MAFPTSPSDGQEHENYIYNSTLGAWEDVEYIEDPTQGLISYWPFNEGEGDKAHDIIGNNHGVIVGANWSSGLKNRAISFNGDGDYIDLPNIAIGSSWSIFAWYYANSFSSYTHIFTADVQGDFACKIGTDDTGKNPYFHSSQTGSKGSDFTLLSGKWYHLGFTYSNNNLSIYIDGILDISHNISFSGVTSDFHIGKYSSEYSNGIQDETRLYNRALTEQEIKILYRQGLDKPSYKNI